MAFRSLGAGLEECVCRGAEGWRGDWSTAKSCQPPTLMRENESEALLGRDPLFWYQREAWCQITAVV